MASSLKDKTMRELLEYQEAARLICAKYENLNKMAVTSSQLLNDEFLKFKAKYDFIMDEIESRLEKEIKC